MPKRSMKKKQSKNMSKNHRRNMSGNRSKGKHSRKNQKVATGKKHPLKSMTKTAMRLASFVPTSIASAYRGTPSTAVSTVYGQGPHTEYGGHNVPVHQYGRIRNNGPGLPYRMQGQVRGEKVGIAKEATLVAKERFNKAHGVYGSKWSDLTKKQQKDLVKEAKNDLLEYAKYYEPNRYL